MNKQSFWIRVIAVAATVLGIAILFFGSNAGSTPEPQPSEVAPPGPEPAAASESISAPETASTEATSPAPIRVPTQPAASLSLTERMAAYPQGISGRVMDERGHPLAGAEVYLLESARNDALALPVLQQQGLLMGPVAETRSANDGTFALGLQLATDKLYEVRLTSKHHA
ncbi:MAG: hypothetical protein KDC98_15765, partial [Planctomycetes bacterium]|nr:hypothetical protein [Planctomycetota bacterium]